MEMQLYPTAFGLPGRTFAQVYREQAICKYYVCGSVYIEIIENFIQRHY